jgi:hypothetical protein
MKPEFPTIAQDKMASPHAQEIELALILSQMINTVKENPSQMRLMIYEYARSRLKIDTAWLEGSEWQRLSDALETAIQGVEQFSARRDEKERLQPSTQQFRLGAAPAEQPSVSVAPIYQVNSAPKSTLVPTEVYRLSQAEPAAKVPARVLVSTWDRYWFGLLLFGVVAGLAVYSQWTSLLRAAGERLPLPIAVVAKSAAPPSILDPSLQSPVVADVKTTAVSTGSLPFPLPSDYGVYALNNTALSELYLLPEQVPDKRVAMSTPVSQPSRTTIPDGKAKFVVFRRDIAGNAPDRIEVRVVARVVRALTFDAKGKASFSPVADAWNIRNLSYEFRVRPIPENPEMLLVQSANTDFVLPAGRYVLVLGNQGYDFTVRGQVTDPSQCIERTDAANGAFYSDCSQKQ